MKASKVINLRKCSKDKYGRLLCNIEYDNKDLTKTLLDKHYGYAYYGDKKNTSKIQDVVNNMVDTK